MSLATVEIILFAFMNIIGTWYFVRVTSVDPRFSLSRISAHETELV